MQIWRGSQELQIFSWKLSDNYSRQPLDWHLYPARCRKGLFLSLGRGPISQGCCDSNSNDQPILLVFKLFCSFSPNCNFNVLFALYFFLGLSYSILPEFLFAQHFYFKPLLYFLPTGPFLSLHLFPVLLSLQSHPFLSGTHFLLCVITDSDICSKQKIWIHLTYFLSS